MLKQCAIFVISFVVVASAPAQIKPPSKVKEHRGSEDLEKRYNDLRCALVVIQSGNKMGTGFYISPDGNIVTAAHVIADRIIEPLITGQFNITLNVQPTVTIKGDAGEFQLPMPASIEKNADQWSVDLAVLNTGKLAHCWLKLGDDALAHPGQHVITMGFPGLAFGSLSIYTGIISARLKSDFIVGTTSMGQPLKSTNDFLRVQMPISTGISGSPVINDRNEAISVITNAGGWTQDLELLTQVERTKEQQGQSPAPTHMLDWASALGQLAGIFHDFASPGYGDSVPLSYLKKKEQPSNQQPAQSVH